MEERIKFLVAKFHSGELSAVEKAELHRLVEDYPSSVSAEITDLLYASESNSELPAAVDQHKWNKVLGKILAVDRHLTVKKSPVKIYLKWIAVAAVLALAIAVVLRIQTGGENKDSFATDIAPGRNRATLTLANGKKISLNEIAEGELIREAGLSISKAANGQLIYHI